MALGARVSWAARHSCRARSRRHSASALRMKAADDASQGALLGGLVDEASRDHVGDEVRRSLSGALGDFVHPRGVVLGRGQA